MESCRETVLTFDCDEPDLRELAAHPLLQSPETSTASLRATYYDTDAGDLKAAGLMLRVCRETGAEGERVVQAIVADGRPLDRPNEGRVIAGPAPDRAALAETPAAAVLAQASEPEIAARFSTVVERTERPIRYGASAIVLRLDLGHIETPETETALCGAALTLAEGDPADLFALAQALAETVPLRLRALPEPALGAAMAEGRLDRPSKAERVGLDAGASAGDAFAAVARACLQHLRRNEAVYLRRRDPEALHQIRVALRRLRSAFSLFKPLLAADPAAATLRDEIKRVTEPFGRARNLDVFLAETLAPEIERRPDEAGLRDLRVLLEAERAEAHDTVSAILDSAAWRGLTIDLVAWIEAGPWRGALGTPERDRPAEAFAAAVLDRLLRRIGKRGRRLDRQEPEARHRVRIEAKKLRYGAEFFAALYAGDRKGTKRHKAFVAALAALQDHLGALNDIATAHTIGAGLPVFADGERPEAAAASFAAGIVAADAESRSKALLRDAAEAHAALLDVRPFWR